MKKVKLTGVDLSVFSDFISNLTELNSDGNVFFKLTPDTLETHAHNEAHTAVKSISIPIANLCEKHNIEDTIKLGFYHGKTLLKQLALLSGEVSMTLDLFEYDGSVFMEKMNVTANKTTVKISAIDYNIMGFDNVGDEVSERMKDVESADCSFNVTAAEITQIKKLSSFDDETEVIISVNGSVKFRTEDDGFDMEVDEEFKGLSSDEQIDYKLSKRLFNLVDADHYTVYPMKDTHRVNFESQTKNTRIILMVHEEIQ